MTIVLMSVTLFTPCKNSSVAPVQQPDEESIRNQLLEGTIIEENDADIEAIWKQAVCADQELERSIFRAT